VKCPWDIAGNIEVNLKTTIQSEQHCMLFCQQCSLPFYLSVACFNICSSKIKLSTEKLSFLTLTKCESVLEKFQIVMQTKNNLLKIWKNKMKMSGFLVPSKPSKVSQCSSEKDR
jgi:hypothetical protein